MIIYERHLSGKTAIYYFWRGASSNTERPVQSFQREIEIPQIMSQTGMSYREAEDYLKRRGE